MEKTREEIYHELGMDSERWGLCGIIHRSDLADSLSSVALEIARGDKYTNLRIVSTEQVLDVLGASGVPESSGQQVFYGELTETERERRGREVYVTFLNYRAHSGELMSHPLH